MNTRIYLMNVFDFLSSALFILIFVRIILSWVPNARNAFTQIIFDITEPILKPFRVFNPKSSPLDLSPIIVIILLEVIRSLLRQFL